MLYTAIAINTIAIIISIITINILQNRIEELKGKYSKIELKKVNIGDIKITHWFKQTTPKDSKIERKEKYLLENGMFESRIILDNKLRLKDGYTSYLLAKKYNIKNVDVIII